MLQNNGLKNLGIAELSNFEMQNINGGGFLQWVGEVLVQAYITQLMV